uniref:Uncharacterized protein n=1 Tax=Meloidogyne hapla TaxID=6305 RepID=A0A1I8B6P3_MELHA
MAQSSNNNNSTDNNENGIDPRRYRQSTQRKQKQNSQKDVNNDKNGKFVQRFGWNKIVEKKYIPEEYYSFAGCSSSLFSSPKFNNSENQQFLRRQSPSKNIRVITPTKQPQLQRKQKIKEITNKNFQKNKTKNDFNKNKNPKVFRQQNGEETNQNGLNKYNNSNQKGSLLKLNNNIQDNHRLIRQSSKPLIPLKEALQINGKANELSRLYGQFNSLPNGIPPNAICLPRRRRHRPKCSSLAEVNEADLSINEGEQLFTRSLVGVILKSPLEENSDGNINNSCVEFLIYCVIKKRFNTIVQLKADGLIN